MEPEQSPVPDRVRRSVTTLLPRIAHVTGIGPTSLRVGWRAPAEEGVDASDDVDLAGWIATGGTILAALDDASLFATARLGPHGASVVWGADDGDQAIDAYHLLQLAREQRAFGGEALASWQSETGLSNREAADFIGVSLSAWNAYKAGTNRMPAAAAMVCRAALRDPLLLQAHYRPRRTGRPRKVSNGSASEPT